MYIFTKVTHKNKSVEAEVKQKPRRCTLEEEKKTIAVFTEKLLGNARAWLTGHIDPRRVCEKKCVTKRSHLLIQVVNGFRTTK